MPTRDEIILPLCAWLAFALWCQIEASGNIGNRPYCIWYETHLLIEKKGICKWIYFRPKHFERYTLYEAVSFFASFGSVLLYGLFFAMRIAGLIGLKTLLLLSCLPVVLVFLLAFAVTLINDVGTHRDEKKKFYPMEGERETVPPMPEALAPQTPATREERLMADVIRLYGERRNRSYYTAYNLWDSYRVRLREAGRDAAKRDRVNRDYIEYFRCIEQLRVVRENKSGALQLRIEK